MYKPQHEWAMVILTAVTLKGVLTVYDAFYRLMFLIIGLSMDMPDPYFTS